MGTSTKKKYDTLGTNIGDYKTINTEEQATRNQALTSLSGLTGNYDNLMKQMSSPEIQNLLGGYAGIGQNITNAANAFGDISYDPEAANRALLNNMSGYSNAAQQAANMALSGSNQSARDLAQLATQDAMRESSAQLASAGLLGSGAANQSLFEAAYRPQAELQSNLANMQSQYTGNILSSLMGSGANLLGSGYATQNSNALAAAQAGLQGATSQLDVLNSNVSGLQNNYLAQLQALSGLGSNYSNLAGLTQQVYTTPQYAKKPGILDYLSGMAGAAGGAGLLMTGIKG